MRRQSWYIWQHSSPVSHGTQADTLFNEVCLIRIRIPMNVPSFFVDAGIFQRKRKWKIYKSIETRVATVLIALLGPY